VATRQEEEKDQVLWLPQRGIHIEVQGGGGGGTSNPATGTGSKGGVEEPRQKGELYQPGGSLIVHKRTQNWNLS